MTATTCPTCGQPTGLLGAVPALVGRAVAVIPVAGPVAAPLAEALARELIAYLTSGGAPPAARRAALPDAPGVLGAVEGEWAAQDTARDTMPAPPPVPTEPQGSADDAPSMAWGPSEAPTKVE
jgi:hypothetical protein